MKGLPVSAFLVFYRVGSWAEGGSIINEVGGFLADGRVLQNPVVPSDHLGVRAVRHPSGARKIQKPPARRAHFHARK